MQIVVKGKVCSGYGHFKPRMTRNDEAFKNATGESLFPGTLNVDVGKPIPIKEDFRIRGAEIGESEDFIFEKCRINGIPAYRIRPFMPADGSGGHGDHILEISSAQKIPNVPPGAEVEILLFRDDLGPLRNNV